MKKSLLTASILTLSLVLAACGGGNANEEQDTNNASAEQPAAQQPAEQPAAEQPAKNEKLIVYTNANSDGRGDWLVEKAKAAGFEIEIVGAGGADLTNRLIAEKNNPVADVVFGLNNMLYENLKKENVLIQYVPAWAADVEAGLNDPEGYYHGLVKQAILLGYNPDIISADKAPKDWLDLGNNPEFQGKYEAPTMLGQITPQLVVAGILTRYQDANGEYGIAQAGWDEIKKLYDNGVGAVEGEDTYANIASGKTPIGTIVSGTLKKKTEQYGVAAGTVSPEVGVPMIVEHAGIVNGTKKIDTAQRFVEWMGTAEVQGEFAAQFNAMPANTKAAEQANEEVKALYASLKAQAFDWGFISDNVGSWVEKIELEIMK
ncbi:extracellular solute-binding protein [Paenibacillus antri]|uniref:Extracellular solute-binding protein n=1 Tax=Paenibacillus antri TaxID=2582848 RepID=A0A5R9GKP2_9BACL|nr:extracellular solute-binding protein [Paenibacillus antri]TLS54194.1 extracellular solute-binding protein [Paenibacillus antri]